jgi:hypothetical protein
LKERDDLSAAFLGGGNRWGAMFGCKDEGHFLEAGVNDHWVGVNTAKGVVAQKLDIEKQGASQ